MKNFCFVKKTLLDLNVLPKKNGPNKGQYFEVV